MLPESNLNNPADEVIHRIKGMLSGGELQPGSRLPAERKLSEMFGVGRTHVRQALQKLEFYGIVKTFPQSGSVIATMKVDSLQNLIADVLKIDGYDFRSLVEMRVILEINSIRLCALNRTEDELTEIRAAMEDFLAHFNSPQRVEKDFIFHRAIARASQNNVLCSMLLTITPDILRHYHYNRACAEPDQKVIDEHQEMIRCIAGRDPQQAEEVMKRHLAGLVAFSQSI